MPLYAYKCPACGNEVDMMIRSEDASKTVPVCSKCGTVLHKQFSAPSFAFRGSGFYATEYKGK